MVFEEHLSSEAGLVETDASDEIVRHKKGNAPIESIPCPVRDGKLSDVTHGANIKTAI